MYPGDPLTPVHGATENADRLRIKDTPVILKIPVLPISMKTPGIFSRRWVDRLFRIHGGSVADDLSYRRRQRICSSCGKIRLALKPVHDVVADIKGSTFPDQWILRGNHHDAWVFGASDPMSGQVALLAEAKAIGRLVQQGWRPKRTIVYLSWDAEEPALLGSTEWVESHADELRQKALVYINSDTNGRGFLNASGSPSLQHLVDAIGGELIDPETGVSVLERKRAQLQFAGNSTDAGDEERGICGNCGGPDPGYSSGSAGIRLGLLGLSRSPRDLTCCDLGFTGEGEVGGVYHSAYDT